MVELDKMGLGEALHGMVERRYKKQNIQDYGRRLSKTERKLVNNFYKTISPTFRAIDTHFEVKAIERWISRLRIDAMLIDKYYGNSFVTDWKFKFTSKRERYYDNHIEQVLKYMRHIKVVDYGLVCYFYIDGGTSFCFVKPNGSVDCNSDLSKRTISRFLHRG